MANERITELPSVVTPSLSDIFYLVQGFVSPSVLGTSVQATIQQYFNLMLANTILHFSGNPNGSVAGSVYQLCWDTTNNILYVCTTTGSTTTAVWTQVAQSAATITTPAHGGTGVANPTAHTLPIAEGSSNFSFAGPLTNGQLLVGSTGNDPVPAAITAGTGISITNAAGSITITATGSGAFNWVHVTGTSQSMSANSGYLPDNAGLVTLTLPATANLGDEIDIVGIGSGGWSIVANTGQIMRIGSSSSTVTTGSVSSTNRRDSLILICTVANTEFTALSIVGNLTIV